MILSGNQIEFVNALNGIRYGDKTAIEWLNSHTSAHENTNAVYLCGTNRQAQDINMKQISKLKGKESVYNATVEGIVLNSDKPTTDKLHLEFGARVMTLTNTREYRNGSMCTVKKCYSDYIVVRLDDGQETEINFYTTMQI